MKLSEITTQLTQNPKYSKLGEQYINGIIKERILIREYNKLFSDINEDVEEDEELVPEEIPLEEPDDIEDENLSDDKIEGETELEPEAIPIDEPEFEEPIIDDEPIEPKPAEDDGYIRISSQEAKELLSHKGKIFQAVFTKKEDGTLRAMNGMTGVRKYTSGGELPYSPKDKNVIPVYDLKIGMGPKGYRMINVDGLRTLHINGKKYKIDSSLKEIKINKPLNLTFPIKITSLEQYNDIIYKLDKNGYEWSHSGNLKYNQPIYVKCNEYPFILFRSSEDKILYTRNSSNINPLYKKYNKQEEMKTNELKDLVREVILEIRTKRKLNENEEGESPKKKKTSFNYKSTFEDLVTKINISRAPEFNALKQEFLDKLESSGINSNTKKTMMRDVSALPTFLKLQFYANNALLKYEKMGLKENQPAPQRQSPDRETITKPETDTPDIKPRRRTLTPPTESPNTKPKAEGVEKELASKMASRFNKLK